LADTGIDLVNLKRFGGWKSDTVAQGYIGDSKNNKKKLAEQLLDDKYSKRRNIEKENNLPNLSISNCSNCSFNIVLQNSAQSEKDASTIPVLMNFP